MYTTAGIKTNISKPRIDSLQGLRAIAFLAVFISHAGIGSYGALGAWGVSVFIIMSGFLSTYNYFDKELIDDSVEFSARKIRKLYALHVIMLLSAVLLELYSIFKHASYGSIAGLVVDTIMDAALLQAWIPKSEYYFSLNSVSWYLSVAAFLYLAFPNLLRIIKKYNNCSDAIFGIVIAVIAQIVLSLFALAFAKKGATEWFSQHWMTYVCPIYRLGDFFIGCSLGYIYINRKPRITNAHMATIAEIAVVALTVGACKVFADGESLLGCEAIKYTLLFMPVSAALVMLTARNVGLIAKSLETKAFVWLGNVSAYTFLIHIMTIRYFGVAISRTTLQLSGVTKALLALIITVLFAKLYQIIYEKLEAET